MAFADLVAAVDRAAQGHLGGVTVVYQSQHEDPIEIPGMFDERYVLVDPAQGGGVEQVGPALFVRLSDLPILPDDDEPRIEIGERAYQVIDRQPDGVGGMRLLLRRVT